MVIPSADSKTSTTACWMCEAKQSEADSNLCVDCALSLKRGRETVALLPGEQVAPIWIRILARHLDFGLAALLFSILLPQSWQVPANLPLFLRILEFSVLSIPLEALLLSWLGTTPGKFCFGIEIKTNKGERLSLRESLSRSMNICIQGVLGAIAICLLRPIASRTGVFASYLFLGVDFIFVERSRPIGPGRLVVGCLLIACFWILFFQVPKI